MQDSVIRPTNTTASRLVATAADKKLVSVADFTAWISGTANEIEVTDNLDGTITIGIVNSPTLDGTNFSGIPDSALVLDYVEVAGDTMTGELIIDPVAGDIALDCQKNITLKSGQKIIYDGA